MEIVQISENAEMPMAYIFRELYPVHQLLNPAPLKYCGEIFKNITQQDYPRTSKRSNSKASRGSTTSPLSCASYVKALLLRGPLP
jgi:hypothetical protein